MNHHLCVARVVNRRSVGGYRDARRAGESLPDCQRGVGLIEMMIVMVIGLLLVGAVGSLYLNFKKTYRIQKSQTDFQDSFRYTGTLLTGILRQAGYASMQVNGTMLVSKADVFRPNAVGSGNFTAAEQVVYGQQSTFANVTRYNLDGSTSSMVALPRDSISIRFMGGTGIYRCLGRQANLDGVQYSATFRVNGNHELECVDEVVAGAPVERDTDSLVGNAQGPRNSQLRVLGMSVWYGEDSSGNGSVDQYRRAAAVTDWTRVRSARIDFTVQAGELAPKTFSYAVYFRNAPEAG